MFGLIAGTLVGLILSAILAAIAMVIGDLVSLGGIGCLGEKSSFDAFARNFKKIATKTTVICLIVGVIISGGV
jgi:hypothetical protein